MFGTHAGNIIVSTLLCYIPHYTQATLLPYYFPSHYVITCYLTTSLPHYPFLIITSLPQLATTSLPYYLNMEGWCW